jgi:hypothetical protein
MITIWKIVTKLCHLPYSTFLIETIMSPFSNSLIISRKASGTQIMRLSPIFEILAEHKDKIPIKLVTDFQIALFNK